MSNGGDILDPVLYGPRGKTGISSTADDLFHLLSRGDTEEFLSRRGAILAAGACRWSSSGTQTSWTVDILGKDTVVLEAYRADVSARAVEYEAYWAEIETDMRRTDPDFALSEDDKDEMELNPTWTLCEHRRGAFDKHQGWLRCADLLTEIDRQIAAARGRTQDVRTSGCVGGGAPTHLFAVMDGRTACFFDASPEIRAGLDAALAAAGTDWISARAEAVGNGAVWADSDGIHLRPGSVSDEDAALVSARLSGLSAAEEAPRLSAHEKLDLFAKLASMPPEALFVQPRGTEDAWNPDAADDGGEIPF